jgi:hypothetical protein
MCIVSRIFWSVARAGRAKSMLSDVTCFAALLHSWGAGEQRSQLPG